MSVDLILNSSGGNGEIFEPWGTSDFHPELRDAGCLEWNYTHNLGRMQTAVFAPFNEMPDRLHKASDLGQLREMLLALVDAFMKRPSSMIRDFTPANGWGCPLQFARQAIEVAIWIDHHRNDDVSMDWSI